MWLTEATYQVRKDWSCKDKANTIKEGKYLKKKNRKMNTEQSFK